VKVTLVFGRVTQSRLDCLEGARSG